MNTTELILFFGKQIGYTSVLYYLLLPIEILLYYLVSRKWRWLVLFAASVIFYFCLFPEIKQVILFVSTIFISWLGGIIIDSVSVLTKGKRKVVLAIVIVAAAYPLLFLDGNKMIMSVTGNSIGFQSIIIPIGLSFYTLQMIAYLADIYLKKESPQRNLLKYALFISFFPHLLQGPIPRYGDLFNQLVNGNLFESNNIKRGFQLILWGFFLKFMIADKASIVVDTVFDNYRVYEGNYCLIAGVLYSIQLYADFLACTTLAQGTALTFGIHLSDNFRRPYFSSSVKDFWHRWHISLSSWIRDYIYIPLGGNRKGQARKYVNLLIAFLVSGIWHGGTMKFILWGMLHGLYQIVGGMSQEFRDRFWQFIGLDNFSKTRYVVRVAGTSFWVMLAWIIFRADNLKIGLHIILSAFTTFNPWVLTGGYIFGMGLSQNEFIVLCLSILVLLSVSILQEKGVTIGIRIMELPILFRYAIYLAIILIIMIFGTYGFGFNASDFIYKGF